MACLILTSITCVIDSSKWKHLWEHIPHFGGVTFGKQGASEKFRLKRKGEEWGWPASVFCNIVKGSLNGQMKNACVTVDAVARHAWDQLCSYRYALSRTRGVNQKDDRALQIIHTLTEFQPASKTSASST